MSTAFLLRLREFELNPIVVKELRQAVRSQTLVGGLLGHLAILFTIVTGTLLTAGQISTDSRLGPQVLDLVTAALLLAVLLVIPAYLGVRTARELDRENLDLMMITTLKSDQIMNGKVLSGLILAGLFCCASLPFLAVANLLRGVDWISIAAVLGVALILGLLAMEGALFAACLPWPLWARALFGFFGMLAGLPAFGMIAAGVLPMARLRGARTWVGDAVIMTIIIGFVCLILHAVSTAMICGRKTVPSLRQLHPDVKDPCRF